MDDPIVHLEFTDGHMVVQSDLADGTIKWKSFHELWRFNDVWMLFVNPMMFYILPTEAMTDALREHILAKLAEHDIPVK